MTLIYILERVQSRCYAWPLAPAEFVDDIDCPYVTPPNHPFVWIRSWQLGGRVVIPAHGRQYYRFGDADFFPADGLSPSWPFGTEELTPWYENVERRLEISGSKDRLKFLPDSEVQNILEPTASEAALQKAIRGRWPNARPVLGRFAPPPRFLDQAAATGRLFVRIGAIVRELEVDTRGRIKAVIWIDRRNGSEERVAAPLVFLCASTLESTRILLLSKSSKGTGAIGGASGTLGKFLMDHVLVRASGRGGPLKTPQNPEDRRSLYLPRFDWRDLQTPPSGRGFGVQVAQTSTSQDWSQFNAAAFGEMLPRPENRVWLDRHRRDAWGIPVLNIDCHFSDAELRRARNQAAALLELAAVARAELSYVEDPPAPPGTAIHECGTARMGKDPESSVLDSYNECWEARGLYITDGACFPSQGTQNPMLTILALTARACDHALRNSP